MQRKNGSHARDWHHVQDVPSDSLCDSWATVMIPAIWVQMEQEQQANEQEFASEDVNHTTLMTEFNFLQKLLLK